MPKWGLKEILKGSKGKNLNMVHGRFKTQISGLNFQLSRITCLCLESAIIPRLGKFFLLTHYILALMKVHKIKVGFYQVD